MTVYRYTLIPNYTENIPNYIENIPDYIENIPDYIENISNYGYIEIILRSCVTRIKTLHIHIYMYFTYCFCFWNWLHSFRSFFFVISALANTLEFLLLGQDSPVFWSLPLIPFWVKLQSACITRQNYNYSSKNVKAVCMVSANIGRHVSILSSSTRILKTKIIDGSYKGIFGGVCESFWWYWITNSCNGECKISSH